MTKSEIMKQAWRFYKGIKNITFSEALKKSWEMAKSFINDIKIQNLEGSEKQVKWGNKIREKLINMILAGMKRPATLLKQDGFKVTTVDLIIAALALKQKLGKINKASELIALEIEGNFEYGKYYAELIKNYKFF